MVENSREVSSSSPDHRRGHELPQHQRESSSDAVQQHTSHERSPSHTIIRYDGPIARHRERLEPTSGGSRGVRSSSPEWEQAWP